MSLEFFNMVFRNNSSKGIFGEIMSNSKKLKLSGDSRWLQKVINRARKLMVREKGKDAAALFFGSISIQSPKLTKSRVHNGN